MTLIYMRFDFEQIAILLIIKQTVRDADYLGPYK